MESATKENVTKYLHQRGRGPISEKVKEITRKIAQAGTKATIPTLVSVGLAISQRGAAASPEKVAAGLIPPEGKNVPKPMVEKPPVVGSSYKELQPGNLLIRKVSGQEVFDIVYRPLRRYPGNYVAIGNTGDEDSINLITDRSQIVDVVGPENLTVEELNEVLTHFHFSSEGMTAFEEADRYYGQALLAKWFVTLNESGIPLKDLALSNIDDVYIKINLGEGRNGFLPATAEYPKNEIEVQNIKWAFIHEMTHWLLRRGVGRPGLNEVLAEIQNDRLGEINPSEYLNEDDSKSCALAKSNGMTLGDYMKGAAKLIDLDNNQLPDIINYIMQNSLENGRAMREHIPMTDVEGWIKEKYGEGGLKLFKSELIFYCGNE